MPVTSLHTAPETEALPHVVGQLTPKDLKRLVNRTRSSNIGPTALYYAGVTAPIVSSGVALTVRSMIDQAGMSTYWIWLISSFIACLAGISWYLIFMRWSYRPHNGRAGETDTETAIDLQPAGIHIRRGEIETRIGWNAVEAVKETRRDTLVIFNGADPLLIPDRWFGKDKAAARDFRARLREGLTHGPQQQEAL